MKDKNVCEYSRKLVTGEILLQSIKANVINYRYSTIHETVEHYAKIVEAAKADKNSFKQFSRTVGYLAGTLNKDGKICIRGSFCVPNDFWSFSANLGKNMAIGKLYTDNDKHNFMQEHKHNVNINIINGCGVVYVMPYTLFETYKYFSDRCINYFNKHAIDIGSMMINAF